MRLRVGLFALLVALPPLGCATRHTVAGAAPAPAISVNAPRPGSAQGWVDTKLYFGLGPADLPGQGISEAEWRTFLDREVTPRFPSGLSVLDAYGQWQGQGEKQVEQLRSKVLVIVYADSEENRAKIEAIRTAWKQKTGDESVLRVTEPADVSF
jgi:hypothetical protein